MTVGPLTATLIAIGEKRIYPHEWGAAHRGTIAVHAAREIRPTEKRACRREPFRSILIEAGITCLKDLPRGAIVCVTELVDERPTVDLIPQIAAGEFKAHEMAFGRFGKKWVGLVFGEAPLRLEEPIYVRGERGLWDVPGRSSAHLAELYEQHLQALAQFSSAGGGK